MKRLFLTSFFSDAAGLLTDFAGGDIKGKTVTFIPTASIPESVTFYVKSGKKILESLGLSVDVLELTKSSAEETEKTLRKNDFIYVSGGNTFFLLQELIKKGADKIISELIMEEKIYIGESAGSMILSPDIEYVKLMDSEKKAPDLHSYAALNVIDFYPLPHYTNFPFAKKVEKIIKNYDSKINLVPIKNTQVILVNGDDFKVADSVKQ